MEKQPVRLISEKALVADLLEKRTPVVLPDWLYRSCVDLLRKFGSTFRNREYWVNILTSAFSQSLSIALSRALMKRLSGGGLIGFSAKRTDRKE
ncbi:MAG: hypothetical protein QXT26_02670 [Thermoproteota archaeon]